MTDFSKFRFFGAVEVFVLSPDKKKVLLMKRALHRTVLPGYYAGLGGKMDFDPIETPMETVKREIFEESGIRENEFSGIDFKGLFTADDKFGKWFVFEFTSVLKSKKSMFCDRETNEGTLTWVDIKKAPKLRLIQDLKQGVLNKILFSKDFLWLKSVYDRKDRLIKLECSS